MPSQVAELTFRDVGSARAAANAMNGCVACQQPISVLFWWRKEGEAAACVAHPLAVRTVLT